jgi:kinesin family protein 11
MLYGITDVSMFDHCYLNCSKAKTTMGAQQWKNAEDSLFSLGKGNVESADSIVRTGTEANQSLRSKLSSAVSTTLEEIDIANKALLSSIDSKIYSENFELL